VPSRAALLREPRADPELRVSPPRMLDARRPLAAVLADLAAPLRGVHARARARLYGERSGVEDGARVRGRGEARALLGADADGGARTDGRRVGGRVSGAPERMGRALPEHRGGPRP